MHFGSRRAAGSELRRKMLAAFFWAEACAAGAQLFLPQAAAFGPLGVAWAANKRFEISKFKFEFPRA